MTFRVWPALALAGCGLQPDHEASFDTGETRCVVEEEHVSCSFETVTFSGEGLAHREVHVQTPEGAPPAAGWPAVFLFQGSLYSAEGMWEGEAGEPFGGLNEARLVAALLDADYAVIAPEARYDGGTWWQTNVPPTSWAWTSGQDHRLMTALFAALEAGGLGPLDPTHLYATGISSGGYMTSRMALSYPGRFRALAIESASWATCGGIFCVLPDPLPADHPPTLFLHGDNDPIVPIGTMERYADALEAQGTFTVRTVDPEAGHEWLDVAPLAIPGWFDAF